MQPLDNFEDSVFFEDSLSEKVALVICLLLDGICILRATTICSSRRRFSATTVLLPVQWMGNGRWDFFVFSRTQARLHSVDKAVLVRNVQHDFACNLRIHIASLRSCKLNVVPCLHRIDWEFASLSEYGQMLVAFFQKEGKTTAWEWAEGKKCSILQTKRSWFMLTLHTMVLVYRNRR